MNCKKGDVAIIVGSKYNDGKIVTCIECMGVGLIYEDGSFMHSDYGKPVWLVDTELKCGFSYTDKMIFVKYVPDFVLKPLKGDLLQDEEVDHKELVTE